MEVPDGAEDAAVPVAAVPSAGGAQQGEDLVDESAVLSYRAARATPWGSMLPEPFLRELLRLLNQRTLGALFCSFFRLVCSGWRAAHDQHCTRLQLKLWKPMPVALPHLERVTEVDVSGSYPKDEGTLHLSLCKLRALPSLTQLTLDIPVAACAAVATALGSLTTLRSVRARRDLDEDWDWCDEDDDAGDGDFLEMVDVASGVRLCWYEDNINDSGWLASLVPLHQLTSLDLSQCHGVTSKALTALHGCTSLDTLALCGVLGRDVYHGEVIRNPWPSLLDDDAGEDELPLLERLLRSLRLSTLSLNEVALNDRVLKALALLPGLTTLNLPPSLPTSHTTFRYAFYTDAALQAAWAAAPHLTIR